MLPRPELVDAVFVRGLTFEASHGYYEEERESTRRFRAHLELRMPLSAAAGSDQLEDTIDYFWLCETVLRIGTGSTFRLLETLCGAIAASIQTRYPRAVLVIEMEKLAPPCPGVPEACGVRLSFAPGAQSPT